MGAGTLEMIQKIQTLQKRLIAKTEEVVEKDLLIQVSPLSALRCTALSPRCRRNALGCPCPCRCRCGGGGVELG